MSATEFQRLVNDVRADEALRAGLAARDIDEFVTAGRDLGYDIEAADVRAAGFPPGELSDGELDAVAGGGRFLDWLNGFFDGRWPPVANPGDINGPHG